MEPPPPPEGQVWGEKLQNTPLEKAWAPKMDVINGKLAWPAGTKVQKLPGGGPAVRRHPRAQSTPGLAKGSRVGPHLHPPLTMIQLEDEGAPVPWQVQIGGREQR